MTIKQRHRLAQLGRMKHCCRRNEGGCNGRITWEHPFGRIIGGKHVPDAFVIALCAYHHSVDEFQDGGGLNKEINKHHAYKNATDEDLREFKLYSQMKQEKEYLTAKYGTVDNSK